jgi:hypothetical protein
LLEKAIYPIAPRPERVGEWWSKPILRDALHGFEAFGESPAIATRLRRRSR